MNNVLSIEDLSIGFPGSEDLVKNISLNIGKGRVHGLIGESGSGKSLTALSIVRLLPGACQIKKGSIKLIGPEGERDMVKLNQKELRSMRGKDIGFVFQDPMTALNPVMRCGKQVEEAIAQHEKLEKKALKERVLSLFEQVRLPDVEKAYHSYPHEVSGGQRQRITIAQAVSCKPALLIADEITTALDVEIQLAIIELLNDLRKSMNLGVLFISHDLGIINHFADDVSIMYKGEIVEQGSKEQIINHPEHPYTKGLLACRPPMDKVIDRLPTVAEFMRGRKDKGDSKSQFLATQDQETLIEIRDISAYYPMEYGLFGQVTKEFHVLKGISFEIKKGESLGLVGESGSGKSSLGRALLHLIEARGGSVVYQGELISAMKEKEFRVWRRKIQFIFQDPYSSLNPKVRIGNGIEEVLMIHGIVKGKENRKRRCLELLEQVGLDAEAYSKFPHQFSGGQRQRIVIARALALEPEFIVCDEAVSALDVSVQAQILNLLKDLKIKLGLTYLFITHDMAVVRFFCDRVLVLKNGEMVESSQVDELFNEPKHPYTQKLIKTAREIG